MGDRPNGPIRAQRRKAAAAHPAKVTSLADFTADLGKAIAFWEKPEGGVSEFIFRKGTEYRLVTEIMPVRLGEKAPAFSARLLSRAEVVEWFWGNHIAGFVPEELRAEFRPRPVAATIEPHEALQRLRKTINALAALATLAAEEVAKYREDDPGLPGSTDEIGDGLKRLTKTQCEETFQAWGVLFDAFHSPRA